MPDKAKPKQVRRIISNEEFTRASEGVPGDEASINAARDNRQIIEHVLKKYSRWLTHDDLKACGMLALWRALQYYRVEYGQKFTTSLFRFVHWECRREMAKKNGRHVDPPVFEPFDLAQCDRPEDERFVQINEDLAHVKECMKELSREEASLIRMHYLRGLSKKHISESKGIPRAHISTQIKDAMSQLSYLCRRSLQVAM